RTINTLTHPFPTRRSSDLSGFNRTLDAINNVFRKFSAFHDETGRLNVDGMNIISNDGSNKLNRSRKARVSYKVQRTINASLNAATSTRAVSSNPNFVTRQKIRSEERFSRNAETDLVCRLLLEKKKSHPRQSATRERGARRLAPTVVTSAHEALRSNLSRPPI